MSPILVAMIVHSALPDTDDCLWHMIGDLCGTQLMAEMAVSQG